MSNNPGFVSEIFQSFQGEGIHVGQRQVFIRFIGCNLSCAYCDTNVEDENFCLVKQKKDIQKIKNPVDAGQVVNAINSFIVQKNVFHSLSMTGGEPLLQVDFIKDFAAKIDIPKYLETNGTLPERLEEIIEFVDIVAMDYKIPSATKCDDYSKQHRKFLEIAQLKEVFVKAVFTKDTTVQDIDDVATLISEIDNNIPLVLQPATVSRSFKSAPTVEQFFSFHTVAKRKLNKVLIIPQCHKFMGIH